MEKDFGGIESRFSDESLHSTCHPTPTSMIHVDCQGRLSSHAILFPGRNLLETSWKDVRARRETINRGSV